MTTTPRTPVLAIVPLLLAVLSALLALLVLPAPRAAAVRDSPAPSTGVWPLSPQPEVKGRFDPPVTRYGAGHRGADLAGAPGQVVRSALPGRVTFAGRVAGRGVVVVDHGTTRTTYQPVSAAVGVGDLVEAADRIGTLETFGSHCGPAACLHWGLLRGGAYLDPLTLVGAGPVRLLPLEVAVGPVPVRDGGSDRGRPPAWDGLSDRDPSSAPPSGTPVSGALRAV